MKLTDSERAMLDGDEGKAKQKAMELSCVMPGPWRQSVR